MFDKLDINQISAKAKKEIASRTANDIINLAMKTVRDPDAREAELRAISFMLMHDLIWSTGHLSYIQKQELTQQLFSEIYTPRIL